MADRSEAFRPQGEIVFCHQCRNQWRRDQHGLECPACHSDCVEVIEEGHDPRDMHLVDNNGEDGPDRNHHLPHPRPPFWNRDVPDSEEGNIEHIEWNAGPGLRFSRTSFRSPLPNIGPVGQRINDPFAQSFQSFSTIMEGPLGEQRQVPFPIQRPSSTPGSPLRESPPTFGRHTYTATARLIPRDTNGVQQQSMPIDQLQEMLGFLLRSLNGPHHTSPGGNGGMLPLHFFAQFLNPANAASGDTVYSEEAFDRIITQFMEQTAGSSAPGPASPDAIQQLPKKAVDKSMLGSDGKAECSVCMDNVDVGDEVTVLPCRHWFHGDCVGAWLKEHDTCPHCRQGIMPKDDTREDGVPRNPGQPPRNLQPQSNPPAGEPNPWMPFSLGRMEREPRSRTTPFRYAGPPDSFPPQPYDSLAPPHRRRSNGREGRNNSEGNSGEGGGGGGGGISGWMRDRFSRSGGDRN